MFQSWELENESALFTPQTKVNYISQSELGNSCPSPGHISAPSVNQAWAFQNLCRVKLAKIKLFFFFSKVFLCWSNKFIDLGRVQEITWPRSRGRNWGKDTNVIFLLQRMEICSVLRLAEATKPHLTPSMEKVQVRRLDTVIAAAHAQLSKRDADEEMKVINTEFRTLSHVIMWWLCKTAPC